MSREQSRFYKTIGGIKLASLPNLFVTTKVFDPALGGKAIQLTGYDIDGDGLDGLYLVKGVDGQYLQLINRLGKEFTLHTENFESGGLNLQILGLAQETKKPQPKPVHIGSYKQRTMEQINADNQTLEIFLKECQTPRPLGAIRQAMQVLGHEHWNKKNACGYVKYAIKSGFKIKQFGYGVYGYDWEEKE